MRKNTIVRLSIFALPLFFLVGTTALASNIRGYDCTNKDIAESQCDALVDLYEMTDGDNWNTNTNWLDTSLSSGSICGSRYGVNCYGPDGVSALDMMDNNLVGILPDTFGNLTWLELIRLEKNKLSGALPQSFSQLVKLKYIYLQQWDYYSVAQNQRNQLAWDLFSFLANMSWLVDLFAPGCLFTGQLPIDIGSRFPNLINLDLGTNDFDGTIPSSIWDLTWLVWLRLTTNLFEWLIPSSIGNLTNLRSLDLNNLNYNDANAIIAQTIPNSFSQLTWLTYLWLTNNNFIGELPDFIGTFNQLSRIELGNNHFIGSLPESRSGLQSIESFRAHENELTGTLPDSWSVLSHLTRFSIASNHIGGDLPSSRSALTNLQELTLNNNNFQWDIPASWSDFSWVLQDFTVSENKLWPTIPSRLQTLNSVSIAYNCFATDSTDTWLASFLQSNDPLRSNQNICWDISITKTAHTWSISVWDQLLYTITYEYVGSSSITWFIIRDNLMSWLTIVSSSSPYLDHDITAYGTGWDMCYDDFTQFNTGQYFQTINDFTLANFWWSLYDAAVLNGFTGSLGEENTWFLDVVCVGNGFPNFQECMQNILGIDITTVSPTCGKTEHVTDWIVGSLTNGSSGSFTITTRIGNVFHVWDIITNTAFTTQNDENILNNSATAYTTVMAPPVIPTSVSQWYWGGGGGWAMSTPILPMVPTPDVWHTVSPTSIYNGSIQDGKCYIRNITTSLSGTSHTLTEPQFSTGLLFAYNYWLTQYNAIDAFRPFDWLTREEAAKIFSAFAINVLCRTPNTNIPNYSDIASADPSLQSSIVLAYQLWLMHWAPETSTFRPSDMISKQEFMTVLVRLMLNAYLPENNTDDRSRPYMTVAKDIGITTQTGVPPQNNLFRHDSILLLYRAYQLQYLFETPWYVREDYRKYLK